VAIQTGGLQPSTEGRSATSIHKRLQFLLKGSLALPNEEDVRRQQAAQSQAEAQRRAQASRLRTSNGQQQTETQAAAQRAARQRGTMDRCKTRNPLFVKRNRPK